MGGWFGGRGAQVTRFTEWMSECVYMCVSVCFKVKGIERLILSDCLSSWCQTQPTSRGWGVQEQRCDRCSERGRDAEDVESHCSPAYELEQILCAQKNPNSGQVQSTLTYESMSITLAGWWADWSAPLAPRRAPQCATGWGTHTEVFPHQADKEEAISRWYQWSAFFLMTDAIFRGGIF